MTEVDSANGRQQHATLSSLIAAHVSTQTPPLALDLDDLASTSSSYLLSLTSKSLKDIRELPTALSQSELSLNTQLSSLCSQHVSSFVQVHHATSFLPNSLATLDATLQTLVDRDLPSLSDAAQQFSPQVEAPSKAKEKAQNLLSQYEMSIKDLMDIPRLLMTCVRASHPVEALQLAIHMMKIESQNEHSDTIRSLQRECQVHMSRLREDLLRALGARGLRLPAAKRLVSLLRKFREVDEARKDNGARTLTKVGISDSYICLSYLLSRWSILEDLTSNLSAPKSSAILSSQLGTWRDTVGDTCGMAQILFPLTSQSRSEEDELAPTALIASFSRQALHLLQRLLVNALPALPEDSISLQDSFETFAAIHTQLSYSAASLSRQGVDISRMVFGHTILQEQVINLWSKAMIDAKRDLERARIGKVNGICLSWLQNDSVLANELLKESMQNFDTSDGLSARLSQLPDLRLFANSILQSYNALLSFAPRIAGVSILAKLDDTLCDVIEPLYQTIKAADGETDLSLSPIVSSQAGSRYYERDRSRQAEANAAILARVLCILCKPLSTYLRGLIMELFDLKVEKDENETRIGKLILGVMDWCNEANDVWAKNEERRRDRVREEEEKLAAEEAARREEEAKKAEEEKRLALELKRKEKEAERERLLKKKEEEEEAERRRLIRLKEEEEAEREKQRQLLQREREEERNRLAKLEEEQRLRKEEEERMGVAREKEIEQERLALQRSKEEDQKIEEARLARQKEEAEAKEESRRRAADEEETARKLAHEAVEQQTMPTAGENQERVEESVRDETKETKEKPKSSNVVAELVDREEEKREANQPGQINEVVAGQAANGSDKDLTAREVEEDIPVDPIGDLSEQANKVGIAEVQEEAEEVQDQAEKTTEQAVQPSQDIASESANGKGTNSGNKLAEKLRLRQEQRQKRAEESSPARAAD